MRIIQVAAAAAGGEELRRIEEAAQSRFKIAGLPAGSTQVGGKTLGKLTIDFINKMSQFVQYLLSKVKIHY